MIKPGCLWWGGSSEKPIPAEAVEKWQKEYGWGNQHHLLHVPLGRYRAPSDVTLFMALARRIVKMGGWVQVMIFGTPRNMATVPVDQVDPWNGRPNYMKYPPRDDDEWARLYCDVVAGFLDAGIAPERLYFGIWLEPHRYAFRAGDMVFARLYGVVQKHLAHLQKARKVRLKVGGFQLSDLVDNMTGPDAPFYCRTPTMTYADRFFKLVRREGWQLDFFDLFQYHHNPEAVVRKIMEVENLMADHGIKAELIFNCLSHDKSPHIDAWSEESAQYTIRLAKMIHTQTTVTRTGFDFVEDAELDTSKAGENGLLEYGTLRERPRWQAVGKIHGWCDHVNG